MLILIILDGYGINPNPQANAVALAKKPNLDRIFSTYPYTTIKTCGFDVGLPDGQMGNSEVGHMNIGAGRIVWQEITRIDRAVADKSFFRNPAFLSAIKHAKDNKKSLHLMGLLSDGGVHSTINHLFALLELCKMEKVQDVFVHAFTDGRDTSPTAGVKFVKMLQEKMSELKTGKLATIVGRYFAMDRDKRWERTEKAYRALVSGQGDLTTNPVSVIQASYNNKVTDEFIEPIIMGEKSNGRISGRIQNNDAVILCNFRADRARQLSFALTDPDFKDFKTGLQVKLTGMCWYHNDLKAGIAFPPQSLSNILGEIVSQTGKRQLRIAETEKYAHVTFFFNGGNEVPFKHEERVLIPSPKVATYDLKPEMSALEVTDRVVEAIESERYELIILNYANCDMVGHTGVLSAAVKAVETVDGCTARVVDAALRKNGAAIITADHGNCEMMVDYRTGEPHTYHTTFVVPLCIVKKDFKKKLRTDGKLANIAPTMLELLNLPQPPEMNQESLITP